MRNGQINTAQSDGKAGLDDVGHLLINNTFPKITIADKKGYPNLVNTLIIMNING